MGEVSGRPMIHLLPLSYLARQNWDTPSMFVQVGTLASSKSAVETRAPELRALITILRSVGPVISTQRQRRSFGDGATRQSAARIACVSGGSRGASQPPGGRSAPGVGPASVAAPPRGLRPARRRRPPPPGLGSPRRALQRVPGSRFVPAQRASRLPLGCLRSLGRRRQ